MGVPAFFRWLSRKYPSVIIECNEDQRENIDTGEKIEIDLTQPNPNGIEFDNLYLDMNGIIHPCTHPEDKPAPQSEDEMMIAIFECIDRIFAIVRPRKLLYMAIDGVAPRAKMNQQRSRRFRASKESLEKKQEMARIRQEIKDKGMNLPEEKNEDFHFDSNCITPGTPFMDRLSKCLHYYVHERLNNDPGWWGIKIILSDANVPGEGEHKIMDYIRKQRAMPDHDPNTHHVLCGADADLIMLGLATHEVNFTIIREEFKPNPEKPCDICRKMGHTMQECEGLLPGEQVEEVKVYSSVNYIFVRLNVLREYLERELQMPNLPFEYDFDRALDDWVMMCFFVGNDFLPHLPSLEIRENAIDRLVKLYKDCCYKTGGWLTDSGSVNLRRVHLIMENLGDVEDSIFKQRQRKDNMFRQRNKQKKLEELIEKESAKRFSKEHHGQLGIMRAGEMSVVRNPRQQIDRQMEENIRRRVEEEEKEPDDEVRLFDVGFKERYYESKFEINQDNVIFRHHVSNEYAVGLCWVLKYYYQGCASWKWYFPYHYAPFASDFIKCADMKVEFELGAPFDPLMQLMGVFPAASRSHVPKPWGELMIDTESNIIDFYPQDFKIDLNGKRFAWQGVALLPFVDEGRLKDALKDVANLLTKDEKRRNTTGDSRLYISHRHKGYRQFIDLYRMDMNHDTEVPMSGEIFEGMTGNVLLADDNVQSGQTLESTVADLGSISQNKVVTVRYRNPTYADDFIFPSKKLEGAIEPIRVLKPGDLSQQDSRNYRPVIGFRNDRPRASLGNAGHRMIGHASGSGDRGSYASISPPQSYRGRGGYNSYSNRGRNDNSNSNRGRGGLGYHGLPSNNSGTRYQSQESNYNKNNDNRYQNRDNYGQSNNRGYNSYQSRGQGRDNWRGGNSNRNFGRGGNNYNQDKGQGGGPIRDRLNNRNQYNPF